jgi:hypothetical protein
MAFSSTQTLYSVLIFLRLTHFYTLKKEAAVSSRKLAHIYQQNGLASPGECELQGTLHTLYSHGRIYLLSLKGF